MLTATQCRMARAALDWDMKDLAAAAKISTNTVARFERERNVANLATLTLIKAAFEAAGAVFIADGEPSLIGGPGVRVREAEAE
jgi:transcriptional regulator with XRE-family HTH domain